MLVDIDDHDSWVGRSVAATAESEAGVERIQLQTLNRFENGWRVGLDERATVDVKRGSGEHCADGHGDFVGPPNAGKAGDFAKEAAARRALGGTAYRRGTGRAHEIY